MLSTTAQRVSDNTSADANARIEDQTRQTVAECAARGPEAIDARLAELDREWDVERTLETVAPSFTLTGLLLGATVNKKWLILPAVVNAFFLQHALQGWCPPLPVLRWLGVRTAEEIARERTMLKALRGDFRSVSKSSKSPSRQVDQALRAAEK